MKTKLTELKNLRTATLLIALMLISYGCVATYVAPPPPPPIQYKNVTQGLVNTPGVTIAAEDGSFVLKYGETFTTPFSSSGDIRWEATPPTPDSFNICSATGSCKKVRVTVPGKKKPLYGYLNLSKMHPTATGPGSRSYLIEIPQRYIEEASGGRVSVVYEWVNTRQPLTQSQNNESVMVVSLLSNVTFSGTGGKQTGWVLWLSDAPF